MGYYKEKVWVITKRKCNSLPRESALLPRDNVAHYQEKVGVITKRMCGLLPRESVGYFQEKM
jgi:hypothetical protein